MYMLVILMAIFQIGYLLNSMHSNEFYKEAKELELKTKNSCKEFIWLFVMGNIWCLNQYRCSTCIFSIFTRVVPKTCTLPL